MWAKLGHCCACWWPGTKLGVVMMMSHEHHVVSNHQSFDCLFNSLCGPTSKKHQIPHYITLFFRGIHQWPVNSPHKGTVMWKKLPFDGVNMVLATMFDMMFHLLLFLAINDFRYVFADKHDLEQLLKCHVIYRILSFVDDVWFWWLCRWHFWHLTTIGIIKTTSWHLINQSHDFTMN